MKHNKILMVRLSEQLQAKFNRALLIYGGNGSQVMRNLIGNWSDKVIRSEAIMGSKYGFRRLAYSVKMDENDGWAWVTLLDVKGGKLQDVKWSTDKAQAMVLTIGNGIAMYDIEQYAKILGCEYVLMSEEVSDETK